ncbi:MAG: hypothetical protein Q8M40_04685 [Legionella sp.]|nr:hypothetical protein [Legionella sp.]
MASQQVEQIQEAKPKDVNAKNQKKFTQHLIHDCTLAYNDLSDYSLMNEVCIFQDLTADFSKEFVIDFLTWLKLNHFL